ncbi:hypothetical protein QG37_02317 [Candidozyma auris]|nr:hypothetical protein QG37_02317 [[Candida] auris]
MESVELESPKSSRGLTVRSSLAPGFAKWSASSSLLVDETDDLFESTVAEVGPELEPKSS